MTPTTDSLIRLVLAGIIWAVVLGLIWWLARRDYREADRRQDEEDQREQNIHWW